MTKFTLTEVKEKLSFIKNISLQISTLYHETDLYIECNHLTFDLLKTISNILNTKEIDIERSFGCDTCGYGANIVIRNIIIPPPKWYIRKTSKLTTSLRPYGGILCELANVEKYKIYLSLDDAKLDLMKIRNVNNNPKVKYYINDYYTNTQLEE